MELLKKLCDASGPPGYEEEVRQVITEHLKGFGLEPISDHTGNLFFVKEGKPGKPRIMLDAHLDEVGFEVIGHSGDGDLRVKAIGGIDDRVLGAKHVLVGSKKLKGVMGMKAPHNQDHDEYHTVVPLKALAVDIGAKDKAEAEKNAPLGTHVAFDTVTEEWGDVIKGKSFDDRAGCWVICKTLEMATDCTLIASFTFGEELGMLGAKFAARRFAPDLMISLEGTSAGDMPEVPEHQQCSKMHGGPVITFEDKSIIIPRAYREMLEDTAKKSRIDYQYKGTVTGGTNAGRMQFEAGGIPCVVIAAPCRYIHSPVSLVAKKDLTGMIELTKAFIARIDKEGLPQ